VEGGRKPDGLEKKRENPGPQARTLPCRVARNPTASRNLGQPGGRLNIHRLDNALRDKKGDTLNPHRRGGGGGGNVK